MPINEYTIILRNGKSITLYSREQAESYEEMATEIYKTNLLTLKTERIK